MTVTVTLRERGSNAFLELRSLFIINARPAQTGGIYIPLGGRQPFGDLTNLPAALL